MKKRTISFILTLVLLFNAFAIVSFASEEKAQGTAEASTTVEETKFVPMTGADVLEAVGDDNFIAGSDFDKTPVLDYEALWQDDRVYYESNGTEITEPARRQQIKNALAAFGERMTYQVSPTTAIKGNKPTVLNNAGAFNLVSDEKGTYLSMTDPLTYDEYMAIAGVYYLNGTTKKYLLQRTHSNYPNLYKNEMYIDTPLVNSTDIDNVVASGKSSFAFSVDIMLGDMVKNTAETYFYSIFNYITSTTTNQIILMKVSYPEDAQYKFTYRFVNESGKSDYAEIDLGLSATEFTRITILIEPEKNTYSIMSDGVVVKKDISFLTATELNSQTYGDDKLYIPQKTRCFQASSLDSKYDYYGNKTNYSIDNLMFYYTDKFIECAHKYVADSDLCSKCEQCGDTKACFDDGVDHIYTNGKFDDRIKLETYYDTAEDKANKTNPHKRLKIGVAKTYLGDDFVLNLNNRMGMYDFKGDDLIIGAPVSEDYYAVNVGDEKQKNEVYLIYKNEELQSITGTDDAVIAEAVNKYKGESFIISGSIKGAQTSGLAEGVNELTIGLLTAHCFRFATKSNSLTGFYLVDLVVTKDENGSPVYTLKTNKAISSDNKPHTIGTVSTENYTDIAAFVDPKTNSVEIYLNGERVLADKEFVFIAGGEKNADWTTHMKSDKYGLNKPEDFMLTATKICSISSGNYSNVTGDILYADRFDIAYADSYTKNVTTYKDGYCDKCGKVMLDVEERNVSLGTSITLNYYVDVADAILNNAIVTLTNGSRTVTLAAAEGEEYKISMRKYSFDMTSIDMTKPVNIRVSVGENASAVYTSSVAEYALALIADESETDEAKALAKAMLNYGAAAQIYFADSKGKPEIAENLANAGLDIADTAIPEVDATTLPEPYATFFFPDYASLILEGKLRLRIYYPGNGDGYTATATVTKKDVTVNVPVGEFLIDASDNLFAITIEDIVPTDYDAVYTLTLSCDEYPEATLKISVNAVIGMILDNYTLSDNYKTLAKALYDYHVKALAYEGV